MKAILEGLNTAFNFDDIVDTHLDDIKTEPVKNSAKTVKQRWLEPKLVLLINDILKGNKMTLTIDEQNTLFEDYMNYGMDYLFPDNETFRDFIQKYCQQNKKANLNWINTSNISYMVHLFYNSEFNGDISLWDVSNVNDMYGMFAYSKFNGDISKWDVSNVTDMSWMFSNSVFNGDISSWDVSNVTNMHGMFAYSKFNGDISKWDVSSVIKMSYMFYKSYFNSDINSWDVSNVKYMDDMFAHSKFNKDISQWDVSRITKDNIFSYCPIRLKFKPNFRNDFTR